MQTTSFVTGEFSERIIAAVAPVVLLLALLAASAVLAWRRTRRSSLGSETNGSANWLASAATGRDAGWIVMAAAVWLVVLDGALLAGGFFRQDDFSFLAVAREGDVWAQIWMRHNDHICPIFRWQVWALVQMAGTSISTIGLATVFNLWTGAVCLASLIALTWLLVEFGVARATLLMAVGVFWSAPGMGEYTGGYFTLNAYVQVLALTFVTVAAVLRGGRTVSRSWFVVAAGAAAVAVGINLSGLLALVAAGIVLLVAPWWRLRQRVAVLAMTAIPSVFVLSLLVVTLRLERTPRELVQNPHGAEIIDTVPQRVRMRDAHFVIPIISASAGLPLGFAVPPVLQYATDRSRHAGAYFQAWQAVECTLGLLALAWLVRRYHALNRDCAWKVLGGVGVTFGALTLVMLARGDILARIPLSLWNPKYTLYPASWFVVSAALLFESWRRQTVLSPVRLACLPTFIVVGALAGSLLHSWLERSALPVPSNYSVRGRAGNLINAHQRARDYEQVIAELQRRAVARGDRLVARVPDDPAWIAAFCRCFPSLEWSGDTGPHGVTYLFADLAAAAPAKHLQIEWANRGSMSMEDSESAFAWVRGAGASTEVPRGR